MGYTPIREPPTWGEVLRQQCQRYPNFHPETPFEIYALGLAGPLLPAPEDASKSTIRAFLKNTFDEILREHDGDLLLVEEMVRKFLQDPAHITGKRPVNPDGYRVRTVPGTNYSIRMWEGSRQAAEWVFEVYDNQTNSPLCPPEGTIQVWHVPNPGWGEGYPARHEIAPLEDLLNSSLGGRAKGKTYLLHDGETCVVNFKEKNTSISFTAPTRSLGPTYGKEGHDHYTLDF
ncbi:hypothetical protein C8T65DRAFT_743660 [Cerioporus squamosus]|nr:hypothetical protein C8T65DRAFT_743660 [Cerioporus squamosus]